MTLSGQAAGRGTRSQTLSPSHRGLCTLFPTLRCSAIDAVPLAAFQAARGACKDLGHHAVGDNGEAGAGMVGPTLAAVLWGTLSQLATPHPTTRTVRSSPNLIEMKEPPPCGFFGAQITQACVRCNMLVEQIACASLQEEGEVIFVIPQLCARAFYVSRYKGRYKSIACPRARALTHGLTPAPVGVSIP